MNRLDEMLVRTGYRSLLGMSLYRYDPIFVEIVGHLGFNVIWIDMEHGSISLEEAGDLCRMAVGVGLLTMIRIPDARRENVLRAAELGPDILDLPMANAPEIAAEFVRHAKYPPEGQRGSFRLSRAMRYGMGGSAREEQARVNRELCLMVQVETREAVERAEELCAVPGVDAILMGPGDLSTSLGVTGEISHPLVRQAMENTLGVAKKNGKRVAAVCDVADAVFWAEKGVDLVFCGGSVVCQRIAASTILKQAAPARLPRSGA